MDNAARAALQRLVAAHGTGIVHDSRALSSMLLHACPRLRIEVDALVAAVMVGVPEALARAGRRGLDEGLWRELAGRLGQGFGFSPAESAWAVDSWAVALGVPVAPRPAPVLTPPPAQVSMSATPAAPAAPSPPPPPPPAPAPPQPAPPPPAVVILRDSRPPATRPSPRPRAKPSGPRSRAEIAVVAVAVLIGAAIVGGAVKVAQRDEPVDPGPAAVSVPTDWVRYVDPTIGFRISYPPGWQIRIDGRLTDFFDPVSRAYLRVDHSAGGGGSAVDSWLELEEDFEAVYDDYTRIALYPTTYQGGEAALWEFTYTDGSTPLHAYDLGFYRGDRGFALYFQTRAPDWERLEPLWEVFKAAFEAP